MKLIVLISVLLLSGCATIVADRSWARCDLIKIAFEEQDDLAPGWYDYALKELMTCGMRQYTPDAAKERGRKY